MQTNDFHPLRSFCAQKVVAFVAFVRLFLLCRLMFTGQCFLRSKSFRKKKKIIIKNKFEIVLIASINYTTTLQDYLIKGSRDFIEKNSLLYIPSLPKLIAIDIV